MVNVVWRNPSDTLRVAEIGGKYYPYTWSLRNAQVYRCGAGGSYDFAIHTEEGIKCVSRPFETLEKAKKAAY